MKVNFQYNFWKHKVHWVFKGESMKAINFTCLKAQLDWAVSEVHNSEKEGEGDLAAISVLFSRSSHEIWNCGTNMGDHKILKTET